MLESISLDREDIIFDGYEVPQIQIKLRLICGEIPIAGNQLNQNRQISGMNVTPFHSSRSINPSIGDGRWYTLTNDIDFTSDWTVINLIIEDVNDNIPEFDPLTPTLIGYPEPEVANDIMPSCLVIVHATDKDAGMNAKIKYTLAEDSYFKIDPESGLISPLSHGITAMEHSFKLTIIAVDNYGATDIYDNYIGLSALHILEVKRLEQKHLTIVMLRGDNVNSSDDVIAQLNSETSIQMMVLHSAHVPYYSPNARQFLDDSDSILKMIVYAFGDDGEPLDSSDVQR